MSATGKQEKMDALYNYLLGTEFKQRVETIVDTSLAMKNMVSTRVCSEEMRSMAASAQSSFFAAAISNTHRLLINRPLDVVALAKHKIMHRICERRIARFESNVHMDCARACRYMRRDYAVLLCIDIPMFDDSLVSCSFAC